MAIAILEYNLLHKERFYSEHTTYNRDNPHNQALKTALEIIANVALTSDIVQGAKQLLLYFEDVSSWKDIATNFDQLKLHRKTFDYKDALALAEMIMLNYCPAFRSGQQQVLALLFEMNVLFERFIYKMHKGAEDEFGQNELSVTAQNRQQFWILKTNRLDILISPKRGATVHRVIIDNKWKIADEDNPSDYIKEQTYLCKRIFFCLISLSFFLKPSSNSSA